MPDSCVNTTIASEEMGSSPEEKQPAGDQDTAEGEQEAGVLPYLEDAFGDEEHAEVKYKVLKWWYDKLFQEDSRLMEKTDPLLTPTLISGNALS